MEINKFPCLNLSKITHQVKISECYAIFPATWQHGNEQCLLQAYIFEKATSIWLDFGLEQDILSIAIGEDSLGSPICIATKNSVIFCGSIPSIIEDWLTGEGEDIIQVAEYSVFLCEHEGNIRNIQFEGETGKLVAICIDKQIQVYELETFKQIVRLEGHTGKFQL